MELTKDFISYLFSILLTIILCCPAFIMIVSFRNSYFNYIHFLKNNIRRILFYSVLFSLFFAIFFYIIINAEHSFKGIGYYLLYPSSKILHSKTYTPEYWGPEYWDIENKLEGIGALLGGIVGYSILFLIILTCWFLILSLTKIKIKILIPILVFYLFIINMVLLFFVPYNITTTMSVTYLVVRTLLIVFLTFILIHLYYISMYGLNLNRIKSTWRLLLNLNVLKYIILSLLVFWIFWLTPILRIRVVEFWGNYFTLNWECFPTEGILILKIILALVKGIFKEAILWLPLSLLFICWILIGFYIGTKLGTIQTNER